MLSIFRCLRPLSFFLVHKELVSIFKKNIEKEIKALSFLFLFRLFSVGCGIILPWLAGLFLEALAKKPEWHIVVKFALFSAGIWLLDAGINAIAGISSRKSSSRFAFHMLEDCTLVVMKSGVSFENSGSAIADRISKDCEQLTSFVYSVFLAVITKILFLVGISIMLIKTSLIGFLVICFLSLFIALPMKIYRKRLAEATHRLQLISSRFVAFFYQQFENIKNIRRNQLAEIFQTVTEKKYSAVQTEIIAQATISARFDFMATVSKHLVTVGGTLVIGYELVRGIVTLGGFTSAHSYIMSFSSGIDFFLGLGKSWVTTTTAVERLTKILKQAKEQGTINTKQNFKSESFIDSIIIKNLKTMVGRDKAKTIIYDDCQFIKGFLHCVVGESGTGKSTFLDVLCGVTKATSGEIIFTACRVQHPVTEISFAFVDQECQMLFDEAEEILGLGGRANISQVVEVLSDLGLAEKVLELKKTTKIYDYSAGLSQGEKQRICVARAVGTNADVLLFDEPTAALDANMRERIAQFFA